MRHHRAGFRLLFTDKTRMNYPVTLLTGFLGVGKTTFLNKMLASPAMKDAFVLINEVGETAIDHLLVSDIKDDILVLSSGCLCCSLRGDLVTALEDLLKARDNGRIPAFDRLVIETTGLADPSPIITTLLTHPYFAMRFKLTQIVTLVDSVHGFETLQTYEEARRQVACADVILVTKTDISPLSESLNQRLRALCPLAERPDAETLIASGFRGELSIKPIFAPIAHVDRFKTQVLITDQAISGAKLHLFLNLLRGQFGKQLLRVKGLVKIIESPDTPLVIHGAQSMLHPVGQLPAWPDNDPRTRLVFITDGLEAEIIDGLFNAFLGLPEIDRPDAEALMNNPLRI
jgi:G3E family GTPase